MNNPVQPTVVPASGDKRMQGPLQKPKEIGIANNSTSADTLYGTGFANDFMSSIGENKHTLRIANDVRTALRQRHFIEADQNNLRFYSGDEGPADPADVSDSDRIRVYIDKICLEAGDQIVIDILEVIDRRTGRIEEEEEKEDEEEQSEIV